MKSVKLTIMNYMIRILNKFTSNCEIVTEKISESLDHRISVKDRLKIKVHITFCRFCRRYQRQLLMMHEFFEDHLKREEQITWQMGSGLSSEARNRIKKNLKKNLE